MQEIGRDWDEEAVPEKERTFKVGGELFEWIYPQWEVGAKLFNDELNPVQSENGGEPVQFDWVQNTRKAVDGVPMFLNPKNDAVKRWKALCARKPPDAIPRHQISQIYNWLVQITGNLLPTTPPSSTPSDAGDGETAAESSADTSSTEATSAA